jgi:hypothetical protein
MFSGRRRKTVALNDNYNILYADVAKRDLEETDDLT